MQTKMKTQSVMSLWEGRVWENPEILVLMNASEVTEIEMNLAGSFTVVAIDDVFENVSPNFHCELINWEDLK